MSTPASAIGGAIGITIDAVNHQFGHEKILDNIGFQVASNSIVALLGPSGCGKTTLLRCLSGLLEPTAGRIRLNGALPREVRHRGDIGFAFQSPILLPWRNVTENVVLPVELLNRSKNGAHEFAAELLSLVELPAEGGKYPIELSGGMQQRVGLARSLINRPAFLFLDEPFGHLDGLTRDHLNEKVRQLWQNLQFTSVLVTHSIEEAVFLADKVVILSPKPSHVHDTVTVPFGPQRDFKLRASQEFFDLVRHIRNSARKFL